MKRTVLILSLASSAAGFAIARPAAISHPGFPMVAFFLGLFLIVTILGKESARLRQQHKLTPARDGGVREISHSTTNLATVHSS
jgi:hypothetical protein